MHPRRLGVWTTLGSAAAALLPCGCLTSFPEVRDEAGVGGAATVASSSSSAAATGGGAGTGGECAAGGGGEPYDLLIRCQAPLAYWRLDDARLPTAVDASGHGYDGTYSASDVDLGVAGVAGSDAASFGGGSGEMTVADVAAFDFAGTAAFSLEAWIRADSLPDTYDVGVLAKQVQDAAGDQGYWLTLGSTGVFRFARILDDLQEAVTGGRVQVGQLAHVVTTYDGRTVKLYVDGNEVASKASAFALLDHDGPFAVGSYGGWGHYDGVIDEVAVYDFALTHGDVVAHHEAGTAR